MIENLRNVSREMLVNEFSLAHLMVLSLSPPEMVSLAARTGYQAIGLRLIAVTADSPGYPLTFDPTAMRDTKARLDDTGIRVGDIEFVKITPEIDIMSLEPFAAAGAELGARHIIAAPYDPDLGRLAERFGALADLADQYNLSLLLEFFPWTVVPDVRAAIRIVEMAHRSNAGILVDTLHFARSGSRLEHLDLVSPGRFPFVHVCDAMAGGSFTTEQLLHTARSERLPPGEGDIDIRGILERLPADIIIGLEVPMDTLTRERGPEEVARRVRAAAERLISGT
jgi:sugar phosphate isomerase/epimerase